jgi:hypothetical protein
VVGRSGTQIFQADWYEQMLDLLACDPNVEFVNIFHLIDDPDLAAWQSGLYFVDRTAKKSARTVRDWIGRTGGACQGTLQPWRPSAASAAASGAVTAKAASVQRTRHRR